MTERIGRAREGHKDGGLPDIFVLLNLVTRKRTGEVSHDPGETIEEYETR